MEYEGALTGPDIVVANDHSEMRIHISPACVASTKRDPAHALSVMWDINDFVLRFLQGQNMIADGVLVDDTDRILTDDLPKEITQRYLPNEGEADV